MRVHPSGRGGVRPAVAGTRCPKSWRRPTPVSNRLPRPVHPDHQLTAADGAGAPQGSPSSDRVLGGGFCPRQRHAPGGSPASASRPWSCRRSTRPVPAPGSSTSPVRGVRGPGAPARSGSTPWTTTCSWPPETAMGNVAVHLERSGPNWWVVDSVQTLFDARFSSAPAQVTQVRECAPVGADRQGHRHVGAAGRPRHQGRPALRGPGCSNTWWIPSCRSTATATTTCASCGRSSTASAPPTRSACSASTATAWRPWFTRPRCCSGTAPAARSVVVPALEGQRPLLVEVQSLVAGSSLAQPRRSAQGWTRALVAAARRAPAAGRRRPVAGRRLRHDRRRGEGYRTGRGPRRVPRCRVLGDRRPISPGVVACGEVGLGGEFPTGASHRTATGRSGPARLHHRRGPHPHRPSRCPWRCCVPSLRVALDTVGLLEQ